MKLLPRKIPPHPRKSEDKASFLLRCLSSPSRSGTGGHLDLVSYLNKLRLPLPHGPTSRQELLDILLRASLDFGLPAIWAFYVGRHPPVKASENTLYLDLPVRVRASFGTLDALQERDSVHRYFRRCAEIIGGTEQTYSSMIVEIIDVYKKFLALVAQHHNVLIGTFVHEPRAMPNCAALSILPTTSSFGRQM